MRLSHLSLINFRSYEESQLQLNAGPNVLLGFNGVGKTNIAEAMGYLSILGSHRVTNDHPLVRHGESQAIIRAQAHRGTQEAFLEVEINPGRSNRARINRGNPVRASDILGILRTVLFAPEDLELIKGVPQIRRRLLDDLSVQLRPALARVRQDYEKVLKQRNALLKSMKYERWNETHDSTLEVWDQQLADTGARLLKARLEILTAMRPHIQQAYQQLSGSVRSAQVRYMSSFYEGAEELSGISEVEEHALESLSREELVVEILNALHRARKNERERAVTLVGPHRDDVAFSLDTVPVKGYASHGETWSYALAIRLASYRAMVDDDPNPGAKPVLILDDVFAELDSRRRRRLASLSGEAEQVVVTAAVDDDVPEELLASSWRVESTDQVSRVTPFQDQDNALNQDQDQDQDPAPEPGTNDSVTP